MSRKLAARRKLELSFTQACLTTRGLGGGGRASAGLQSQDFGCALNVRKVGLLKDNMPVEN